MLPRAEFRPKYRELNSYLDFRLETERLQIRAWTPNDAPQAFEMYGDPEVARYLSGTPESSVESQRELLEKLVAAYAELDRGFGSFPLIEKSTGDLVGAILLKPLPRNEDLEAWRAFRDDPTAIPPIHEIEIGWHLARRHWGKGFAIEAAREAMAYGFDTLKLPEIDAVLYKENVRSRLITEKLGMDYLGSTDAFYGVTVEHFRKACP